MELSTKILPARATSPNPNNSPVDQIYLLVIHKCIIFGFYLGGVSVFQVRYFFPYLIEKVVLFLNTNRTFSNEKR